MDIFRLSWKNIIFNPLSSLLSIVLFALGISLVTFLILFNSQLRENFDRNLAGIDLVIGAKGSPLQLILSSMYHVDFPTGNIPVADAKPFLNPNHPLLKTIIPLSLGDSYRGFRVVGTTHDIVELYGSELEKGRLWSRDFQVVIGSRVASLLELDSGDKFYSTHGFLNEDDFAHEDSPPFIVSGILKQSGTVIDQLILTSPGSVWAVHEHSEDASGSEHESHEETGQVDLSGLLEHEEKDITSILLQYKSKTNFQSLNLMRNINENTNLQAASPAMEMNRLYSMIGVGTDAMRIIAIVIAIVSALSVFISLFNTLRDRKYELALMRVMGGSRQKLFLLVILEGLLISLVGTLVGFVLGHMGMSFLSGYLQESYGYHFSGFQFQIQEVFILVVALALGILAALFPARQASRTDIQKILTDN